MQTKTTEIEEFIKANLLITAPSTISIKDSHVDERSGIPSVFGLASPTASFLGVDYELQLQLGGVLDFHDDGDAVVTDNDDGITEDATWHWYRNEGLEDLTIAIELEIEDKFELDEYDLSKSTVFDEIMKAARKESIDNIENDFDLWLYSL